MRELLRGIRAGKVPVEGGIRKLKGMPFEKLGNFAHVDHHRHLRRGFPEIVFAPGKTPVRLVAIVKEMARRDAPVVVSRVSDDQARRLKRIGRGAVHHREARMVVIRRGPAARLTGLVAVATGGTSDIPVAEEAAVTAETMGARVERVFDVGVAGIHRLFRYREVLESARAIVAVAGMEGALASVIGGIVSCPVIAVPTSIGYGVHLNGITPLLAMLDSCATGVAVVNIDNGLGAGYIAALINKAGERHPR